MAFISSNYLIDWWLQAWRYTSKVHFRASIQFMVIFATSWLHFLRLGYLRGPGTGSTYLARIAGSVHDSTHFSFRELRAYSTRMFQSVQSLVRTFRVEGAFYVSVKSYVSKESSKNFQRGSTNNEGSKRDNCITTN